MQNTSMSTTKMKIVASVGNKVRETALTLLFYQGVRLTLVVVLLSILFYMRQWPDYLMYLLFLAYLIWVFIKKIDSRVPIAAALLLLIATPIYLILNLESYANYLATLAYFFLVIGVIKQFVEYLKEK